MGVSTTDGVASGPSRSSAPSRYSGAASGLRRPTAAHVPATTRWGRWATAPIAVSLIASVPSITGISSHGESNGTTGRMLGSTAAGTLDALRTSFRIVELGRSGPTCGEASQHHGEDVLVTVRRCVAAQQSGGQGVVDASQRCCSACRCPCGEVSRRLIRHRRKVFHR